MDQLLKIRQTLAQLGVAKLGAMGALAAALLLGIIWIASHSAEPMGLLYSGLDIAEAGRISQKLGELKVPYEAQGDGTVLLVPGSQVAWVRMQLAAAGLPGQAGAGYELLDTQSPMNMTSFMQRVQRSRALEGELARSIVALDGVHTARVHIVMPERDTFAREAPKPTASVAVVMNGAMRLSVAQAAAIRLLVSGAVPGLQRDDVSVLDPSGIVLAANGGDTAVSDRLIELKANRERELRTAVTGLLEPLVGRGKVRVMASVDIDSSREVSRDEKFDPQSQIERSKQIQADEQHSDDTRPRGSVSVGQNLPNQQAPDPNSGKSSSASSHNGQTINYEINTTRNERVREPGDTRRITVAVVVDGLPDPKGGFLPRPKPQLEQIAELVRSAVGFDAKRGDVVTVDNLPFLAEDAAGASASAVAPAGAASQTLLIGIAGIVLLLLVGGALVAMFLRKTARIELVKPVAALESPLEAEAPTSLPAPLEEVRALLAPPLPLPAIDGPLTSLYELIDARPEEALAVLRAWIADNT